ncbi:MAG: hypothetical protein V4534_07995 [Myxococcota bacterium]
MHSNGTFILLLLLVVTSASQARPLKELYLVVGSTRNTRDGYGPKYADFHGNPDLTHLRTFDGQATTFDVHPSILDRTQHIEGDVKTFDFSEFILRSVYLERLPTTRSGSFQPQVPLIEHFKQERFIEEAVINLGKAMASNAVLEIEWNPYIILVGASINAIKHAVKETRFKEYLIPMLQ